MNWLSVSSTGLVQAQGVSCDDNWQCPRMILFQKVLQQKPPIGPEAEEAIQKGEEYEEDTITSLKERARIKTQYSISKQVTDTMKWGGKLDAVTDEGVAIEVKTLTSKSKILKVFSEGRPFVPHLAQLVSYMILGEGSFPSGYLVYRNAQDLPVSSGVKVGYPMGSTRAFSVTMQDLNKPVTVIDTLTDKPVYVPLRPIHILRFVEYMNWVFTEKVIDASRPQGISDYSNPCHFCVCKKVCEEMIDGGSYDGDVKSVLQRVEKAFSKKEDGIKKGIPEDVPF